jgi:hypothetical protein
MCYIAIRLTEIKRKESMTNILDMEMIEIQNS